MFVEGVVNEAEFVVEWNMLTGNGIMYLENKHDKQCTYNIT